MKQCRVHLAFRVYLINIEKKDSLKQNKREASIENKKQKVGCQYSRSKQFKCDQSGAASAENMHGK